MKLNLNNLIVADKYAPEAEVVYMKKPSENKIKIRISKAAIKNYLEGSETVQVAYDPIGNILALRKGDNGFGRKLLVNKKTGHGSLDFQHSGLPAFKNKVLLNAFVQESGYYIQQLPSEEKVEAIS